MNIPSSIQFCVSSFFLSSFFSLFLSFLIFFLSLFLYSFLVLFLLHRWFNHTQPSLGSVSWERNFSWRWKEGRYGKSECVGIIPFEWHKKRLFSLHFFFFLFFLSSLVHTIIFIPLLF
jgi:hypothetical protein